MSCPWDLSFAILRTSRQFRLRGHVAVRDRLSRLVHKTRLEMIDCQPCSGQPHPQHPLHRYKLRSTKTERPHRGWGAEITYVPGQRGCLWRALANWAASRSWKAAGVQAGLGALRFDPGRRTVGEGSDQLRAGDRQSCNDPATA